LDDTTSSEPLTVHKIACNSTKLFVVQTSFCRLENAFASRWLRKKGLTKRLFYHGSLLRVVDSISPTSWSLFYLDEATCFAELKLATNRSSISIAYLRDHQNRNQRATRSARSYETSSRFRLDSNPSRFWRFHSRVLLTFFAPSSAPTDFSRFRSMVLSLAPAEKRSFLCETVCIVETCFFLMAKPLVDHWIPSSFTACPSSSWAARGRRAWKSSQRRERKPRSWPFSVFLDIFQTTSVAIFIRVAIRRSNGTIERERKFQCDGFSDNLLSFSETLRPFLHSLTHDQQTAETVSRLKLAKLDLFHLQAALANIKTRRTLESSFSPIPIQSRDQFDQHCKESQVGRWHWQDQG